MEQSIAARNHFGPGDRTVAAILRVMGKQKEQRFQNYHRVLNRAHWSSRKVSRVLLWLLVQCFVAKGAPIVVGIDETIEHRRGSKIGARGIYRDPVRSSKEFFVKTSGLRWISMLLLTPIPWAQKVWALPTFSDTLAFVRQHLWPSCFFARSSSQHDSIEIPRALFDRLVDTLAFTA